MNVEQSATPLRSALDATDSMRRRVLTGGWLAAAMTLAAYLYLWHVHRTTDDVGRLVMVAVTAVTCLIAWTALAVILIVIRMTRRILRAIDLSNRGRES